MKTQRQHQTRRILFDGVRAVEKEHNRLNAKLTQLGRRAYRLPFPSGLLNRMFLEIKGVESLEDARYRIARMVSEVKIELCEAESSVNVNILMCVPDMMRSPHLFPDHRNLVIEKSTQELRNIVDSRLTEDWAKMRLNEIRGRIRALPDKAASYQDEIKRLESLITIKT